MHSLYETYLGKILVLGSSGHLGSFFHEFLSKFGILIDEINERFDYETLENTVGHVFDLNPEIIVNCVGLVDIAACENKPELAYFLNSTVPLALSEKAKRRDIKFCHFSTPSVFASASIDIDERRPPSSKNSIYGLSKAQGEERVLKSNSNAIICRVNFFGVSHHKTTFFGDLVKTFQAKRPYRAFSGIFFNPLFGGSIPKIILELVKEEKRGIYHVVGNDCVSKFQFASLTANLLGLNSDYVQEVTPSEDFLQGLRSSNTCLSNFKLISENIEIPDLETDIRGALTYYKFVK